MEIKHCPKCNKDLEICNFYKSKQTKSGYRCYCKWCEKKINAKNEPNYSQKRKQYRQSEKYKQIRRNYYQKNKKKILKENKEWRNTKGGRLHSYKHNAKWRNIEWDLTDVEFFNLWKKPCYYCEKSIETIGLDRMDSSIGYTVDNIVPCCNICNKMKLDLDVNIFLEHIKLINEKVINNETNKR